MVVQIKIPFSKNFSTQVGLILKMDFYLLFQAYPSPQVALKWLEYSEGSFYYPRKTGLSGFRNRTIQFLWV
jgi:hypothetical protein